MFMRVARHIAIDHDDYHTVKREYYNIMNDGFFLPNSPTLMNAGTHRGNLSACFVLPVEDSIESIFDTAKQQAIIQKEGGGTGFNFSKLRPRGSVVKGTGGVASGVLSFMKVYDTVSEVIKQGGVRRGANIGILNHDHSEILDFVRAKESQKWLTCPECETHYISIESPFQNFNLSVGVTDGFMEQTTFPRTGDTLNQDSELFHWICHLSWRSGDPALLFLDRINRDSDEYIDACNPCGELPLTPYESCNLGSLNLTKFCIEGEFDTDLFYDKIQVAISFLNDVIDTNRYPFKEIDEATKKYRRIGLGVAGYADLLEMMDMDYGSVEALRFTNDIANLFELDSHEFAKGDYNNTTVNAIAPTGTLSLLWNVSSAIEPLYTQDEDGCYDRFALGKWRTVNHPIKHRKTALNVSIEEHIKTAATWQKHIDNGVSKTVNLPNDATIEDVALAYTLAWNMNMKGVTVFRDGCLDSQILQKCDGDSCSL